MYVGMGMRCVIAAVVSHDIARSERAGSVAIDNVIAWLRVVACRERAVVRGPNQQTSALELCVATWCAAEIRQKRRCWWQAGPWNRCAFHQTPPRETEPKEQLWGDRRASSPAVQRGMQVRPVVATVENALGTVSRVQQWRSERQQHKQHLGHNWGYR